jgi:hypothetical protein
LLNKGGVGRRQRRAVEPNVIFEARSAMTTKLKRPPRSLKLPLAYPGGRPGCFWREAFERRNVEL